MSTTTEPGLHSFGSGKTMRPKSMDDSKRRVILVMAMRAAAHLVSPVGTVPVTMELDLSRMMSSPGLSHWACAGRLTPAHKSSPAARQMTAGTSRTGAAVIELLDEWFSDLGFHSEILPIAGHPDKYNLVASAGSGPEGLVLSGHTDTVPFDENDWHQSPFKLTERDNRFYGLGTCDMKGFFALILEAVRDLDLATLKQPLTIIATADEESTMCGALAIRDLSRHLGRHVVIGEPTNLRPIRMHKGMYSQRLRIIGRSGHSSNPALGVNAMEGMHKAITELLAWRDELQQRYRNPMFEVEVPTINLGHIHGGDNPNRICADCELQLDLRPLPGMDLQELRGELHRRVPIMKRAGTLEL